MKVPPLSRGEPQRVLRAVGGPGEIEACLFPTCRQKEQVKGMVLASES